MDSFSNNDKLVIYSLLKQLMESDDDIHPKEEAVLKETADRFGLTQQDINQAKELSVYECKQELSHFTAPQLQELKNLLVRMAYADGIFIKQEQEFLESLLGISRYEFELIADWQDEKQIIVGLYTKNEKGEYCFKDIHSLEFLERTYKSGEDIEIKIEKIPDLEENTYYQFPWTVELDDSERGFSICPQNHDFDIIEPKDLVDRLYKALEWRGASLADQLKRVLVMVKTQLTASSEGTFIYELLQNANDYPVENEHVDVEFHLTDNYLIYRHSGRQFSPRNIAAISKLAQGEKKKEKNAIGYKGIGFKTVFSENNYVFLLSGDYNLRFDESITSISRNYPWQIMPIWTPLSEVDNEVQQILSKPGDFRVQMAIRPKTKAKLRKQSEKDDKSYESIFNNIFKDEKDILFIPNVQSVKVFYDGGERICRIKNREKWALTAEPLVYKFSPEEIEENNSEVKTNDRIPEKYKDFEDTRVSFACQRDGNILKPVENARIYCYLPTQVSLGFPFLMNTDMIPTGPRDAIEKEVKFNHKLMIIAGGKFVEWISMLIKSGEYDVCSVFTIIPSFEQKVIDYKQFVDEFEQGFNDALETTQIIPTSDGNYELIKNVVYDKAGLSASGIMSDEEFLKFTRLENHSLPVLALRKDDNFKSFLKRYADDKQVFEKKHFIDLIANEDFQEWLKKQDNNNKFIGFLLEKKWLKDFLDKKIFLSDKGCLNSANDLFYDIDKYLVDLQAFVDHLNYLSPSTRLYFKDNTNWDEAIKDAFAKFSRDRFVNDELLSDKNKAETISRLKVKNTSIHFFKFLTELDNHKDIYLSLPFFNDSGKVVDDFNGRFVFLSSPHGHEICVKKWLDGINIEFLSGDYADVVKSYFTEHFGVLNYDDSIIINDILLSDDYQSIVFNNINDNFIINKDFVEYLFSHKSAIEGIEIDTGEEKKISYNRFSNYSLFFENGSGESKCIPASNDSVFAKIKPDYLQYVWLDKNWISKIAQTYYSGKSTADIAALEQFFKTYFGLTDLNDARLRTIAKNHIEELKQKLLLSKELNLSFWSFLGRLKWTEQSKDIAVFQSLPLVDVRGEPISDISQRRNKYYYEPELYAISLSSWMPANLVTILSSSYSSIEGVEGLFNLFGFKKYEPLKFASFFEDVIVNQSIPTSVPSIINPTRFSISLDTEAKCIDFHNFMSKKAGLLNDFDKALLKGTPVYVYGKTESRRMEVGYRTYILNQDKYRILEQCSNGLLPEINALKNSFLTQENQKYWTDVMGCIIMDETELCTWLEQNASVISRIIQDVQLNKTFWTWLFSLGGTVRMKIAKLKVLPIICFTTMTDGQETGVTVSSLTVNEVYMSNPYTGQAKIEDFARNHGKKHFISSSYLKSTDNADEWRKFFKQLGVKDDVKDVIYSVIMNNLPTLKDKSFPWVLVDQYSKEIADPEKWKELAPKLVNLQVETTDGDFVTLANALIVTVDDYSLKEPFKMIKLKGEISREYYQNENVRNLINKITEHAKTKKITEFQQWVDAKVDRYLQIQDSCKPEDFKSLHIEFIKDWLSHKDDYIITKGHDIKLYNREGELTKGDLLFLGSRYDCKCDFEKFNITKNYVDNMYLEFGKSRDVYYLLRTLIGCQDRFNKDDIKYLIDRDFSIYFWCKYVGSKDRTIHSAINAFVKDREFNEVCCIPSQAGTMKKAKELYSSSLSDFMKYIPGYEEKIIDKRMQFSEPLTELCKQCRENLTVNDCIDYLVNSKPKNRNRTAVVEWLLDASEDKDGLLNEYLSNEKACWLNGQGEAVHISKLLAIDPNNCKQAYVFKSSQKVIELSYFPAGRELEVCKMFNISVFSDDDLVPNPVTTPDGGQTLMVSKEIIRRLLLVIAFRYKYEWQDWLEDLKKKLEGVKFYLCDSISYGFNELSIDNEDFYFDHNNKTFYYVDSWQDKKVYESFVAALCDYLSMDLDYRECKGKLDENFNGKKVANYLNQNCRDLYDEEFISVIKQYWNDIIPLLDIKVVEEPETDDDEVVEEIKQEKYYEEELNVDQQEEQEEVSEPQEEQSSEDTQTDSSQKNSQSADSSNTSSSHGASSTSHSEQTTESTSENAESQKTAEEQKTSTDNKATERKESTENRQLESKKSESKDSGSNSSRQSSSSSQRQRTSKYEPKTPTEEEIRRFKYQSSTKTFTTEDMQDNEREALNKILGEDLSPEEIVTENYLAQLRFWNSLKENDMVPADVTLEDFVRDSNKDCDYELTNGKYVHRCSARGGILHISPSIWNMVTDDRCIICVFVGAKVNEFFYIHNKKELLDWIAEDAIVIKLTGSEKVEAVNRLYSEILMDTKGTAYTLIRVAYNESYNSLFSEMESNDFNQTNFNDDDYGD